MCATEYKTSAIFENISVLLQNRHHIPMCIIHLFQIFGYTLFKFFLKNNLVVLSVYLNICFRKKRMLKHRLMIWSQNVIAGRRYN